MATFLEINEADSSELKLLWLLFPTWAEELSFLHRIQSKKHNLVSGVSFIEGEFSGFRIFSFIVGVGADAMQCCLQLNKLILEKKLHSPDLVLLAGFAGGCKKEIKTGDVFFVNKILIDNQINLIPETISVDSILINQNVIHFGVCASVDQVATPEEKSILGFNGADLVDMELKGLQDVFLKSGITFFCVRVILDDLSCKVPKKLATCVQKGRLLVLPLVFFVFFNPRSLWTLFLLSLKTSLAKKKLLSALELLINGLNPKNRKNNEPTNFNPYF